MPTFFSFCPGTRAGAFSGRPPLRGAAALGECPAQSSDAGANPDTLGTLHPPPVRPQPASDRSKSFLSGEVSGRGCCKLTGAEFSLGSPWGRGHWPKSPGIAPQDRGERWQEATWDGGHFPRIAPRCGAALSTLLAACKKNTEEHLGCTSGLRRTLPVPLCP